MDRGAKKNAAEKEGGGVAVNVGKDDTTGNERFLFIDSNLVVRETGTREVTPKPKGTLMSSKLKMGERP